MIQCNLCQRNCKSWGSLSKHIRDQHSDYDSKKYYDTFIRVGSPVCIICNSPTKFQNINVGYASTCSHKCGGIYHRQRLASDETKNYKFKSKVSQNQKRIWNDREQSGKDKDIRKKIGLTLCQQRMLLTADERKQKFGWLNKLTKQEKQEWIDSVMKNTGMYVWWKNASDEKIEELIVKRNASKLSLTVDEYLSRFDNLEDKKSYYAKVWLLTEQTYSKYKSDIDPNNLRSPDYHLDHKYSVIRGFYDRIAPEIIASRFNLEIISRADNSKKSANCSIDIMTLMEMYRA
jgi:hypothetical protein